GLVPGFAVGALGHEDEGGEALAVEADGAADALFGLLEVVAAALAQAVEEDDEGPGFLRIVVVGDIEGVARGFSVRGRGLIEEPGGALRGGRGKGLPPGFPGATDQERRAGAYDRNPTRAYHEHSFR